jgi:hypothetical protein
MSDKTNALLAEEAVRLLRQRYGAGVHLILGPNPAKYLGNLIISTHRVKHNEETMFGSLCLASARSLVM